MNDKENQSSMPGATAATLGLWSCVGLSAGFVLLFWSAFYLAWPLVFVGVAPLAVVMVSTRRAWQGALLAFAAGAIFWACGEAFLSVNNPYGVALLACWQGFTIALVTMGTRWCHRRFGVPVALVLPVTWVGAEYLRILGPFGFPIASLALPCHRQLWMIQVCYWGGLYALSFPVAMVNGVLADVCLAQPWRWGAWRRPPSRVAAGAAVTLVVWMGVAGYGAYRLAEAHHTVRPGPVVSVVQPDVVYAANIAQGFDRDLLRQQMQELSEQAGRQHPAPSLIVWPEAIGPVPDFNRELRDAPFDEGLAAILLGFRSLAAIPVAERPNLRAVWESEMEARQQLETEFRQWVTALNVPVLLGSRVWLPSAEQKEAPWQVFNAAVLFTPQEGQSLQRQFKNRLFPLQEWLPWPNTMVHRWLRDQIAARGRLARRLWLTPGRERTVFELPASHGPADGNVPEAPPVTQRPVRYVVSLCSEGLFPQSTASFLGHADGAKSADLLLNIASHGGFQRNRELPMQFALLPFRAVEGRVGVAQSANTGISGYVKPTGEIYGLVTNGARPNCRGSPIWSGGAVRMPRRSATARNWPRRSGTPSRASKPSARKWGSWGKAPDPCFWIRAVRCTAASTMSSPRSC